MVEGRNLARGQWIGRTTQNKVLNFTASEDASLTSGSYVNVRVTQAFPNSLVGELTPPGRGLEVNDFLNSQSQQLAF
jgi:tRNA-2-methylthio-N6-dimethylallyladenosine synthase